MKYFLTSVTVFTVTIFGWFFIMSGDGEAVPEGNSVVATTTSFSETEVGFDPVPELVSTNYTVGRGKGYSYSELMSWERKAGPLKVGLQSGHLDNDEMPEELAGLERNGGGASFGLLTERDVVYTITQLVAEKLRAAGIEVDILPATVPPGYEADAFVSIHADGNQNQSVNGYKMAGPRRDYSGRSAALVAVLYETYGDATGLRVDSNITNRMTAYYAFNWPRYEYAIHPFTPAVIVETGFLTNATDRQIIVNAPERAAAGIAEGILNFLNEAKPPIVTYRLAEAPELPLFGTLSCAPLRAERIAQGATTTCEQTLVTDDNHHYLLLFPTDFPTSTLPTTFSVTGNFVPIQRLDNYFWFRYEVAGIIGNAQLVEN
jgi:hypothetical protein